MDLPFGQLSLKSAGIALIEFWENRVNLMELLTHLQEDDNVQRVPLDGMVPIHRLPWIQTIAAYSGRGFPPPNVMSFCRYVNFAELNAAFILWHSSSASRNSPFPPGYNKI